MLDLFKIIAYFKVYGHNIYGKQYHGYDTGKDNLESYFCGKKGWSENRLKTAVRRLKSAGILQKEPSDKDCTCLSLCFLTKAQLNLIEA